MGFNLITIFILIGLSRWVSHVAECGACQGVAKANFFTILEFFQHVFGWPIELYSRSLNYFRKPHLDELKAAADKAFDEVVEKRNRQASGDAEIQGVLSFSKNPGESEEDFKKRMADGLMAEIAKIENLKR